MVHPHARGLSATAHKQPRRRLIRVERYRVGGVQSGILHEPRRRRRLRLLGGERHEVLVQQQLWPKEAGDPRFDGDTYYVRVLPRRHARNRRRGVRRMLHRRRCDHRRDHRRHLRRHLLLRSSGSASAAGGGGFPSKGRQLRRPQLWVQPAPHAEVMQPQVMQPKVMQPQVMPQPAAAGHAADAAAGLAAAGHAAAGLAASGLAAAGPATSGSEARSTHRSHHGKRSWSQLLPLATGHSCEHVTTGRPPTTSPSRRRARAPPPRPSPRPPPSLYWRVPPRAWDTAGALARIVSSTTPSTPKRRRP